MAITGVPGWIGSSAAAETGQRWMSAAGGKIRLPTPFWMSQMAGRSTFNCILYPDTSRSRDVGYISLNNGETRGALTNNTGIEMSQMISVLGDRWQGGLDEGFCITTQHREFSGLHVTLEGFNGNEILTLPNRGVDVAGARLYYVNWRSDIFWWMKSKPHMGPINVLVAPY